MKGFNRDIYKLILTRLLGTFTQKNGLTFTFGLITGFPGRAEIEPISNGGGGGIPPARGGGGGTPPPRGGGVGTPISGRGGDFGGIGGAPVSPLREPSTGRDVEGCAGILEPPR